MRFLTGFWREPLIHFLAIGVALFAAVDLLVPNADRAEDARRIEVTDAEIAWIKGNFQARWQRSPTAAELRALVDSYVREEILYREALALGLGENDQIIRRRMVQQLELITEDLAAQQPTEVELESYFKESLDQYRVPERRHFEQIYFNVNRRGPGAEEAAERLLAELRSTPPDPSTVTAELGDRLLLQLDDRAQSQAEVERLFGHDFAATLFELEPGLWHGPIASGYGLHLARVTEVVEGGTPELATIRDEVLRDYASMAKQRAREAMYSTLAKRYEIEIDEEALRALSLPKLPEGSAR